MLEIILGLASAIITAYGLAWMGQRVLDSFQKQKSSIKIDKQQIGGSQSANGKVKSYRRGLSELPYRQFRVQPGNQPRSSSKDAQEIGSHIADDRPGNKDLTVLAMIGEHFDKAEDLAYIGYFEKAIDELELALALEPGNSDVYEAMGDLYMELVKQLDPVENLDAAIRCYRNAVGLQPKLPITYYKLGLALERRGYKTEAKEYLEQAAQKGLRRDDMDMLLKQLNQEIDEDSLA